MRTLDTDLREVFGSRVQSVVVYGIHAREARHRHADGDHGQATVTTPPPVHTLAVVESAAIRRPARVRGAPEPSGTRPGSRRRSCSRRTSSRGRSTCSRSSSARSSPITSSSPAGIRSTVCSVDAGRPATGVRSAGTRPPAAPAPGVHVKREGRATRWPCSSSGRLQPGPQAAGGGLRSLGS